MAVEILILSGARRHQRLVLEASEFRAGSDPACEVFFDPTRDPAAKGRGALLRREDDGWHISASGGELTVNQQAVTGSLALRSGDIISLSATGPDFCFRLAAPRQEPPMATVVSAAVPQPAMSLPSSVPATVAAQEQAVADGETREPLSGPSPSTSQWTTWALGGLAACVLLVILWRAFQPPMVPPIVINVPGGNAGESGKGVTKGPGTAAGSEASPTTIETPAPAPPPKPPASAVELPRDAVYLVEVEKAGRFWPFATAVAVGKDTLLSSAREAMQMAAWRQKEGFKLWVVNPALGPRLEIREIRVHGVFATLAEKPSDWIYFNLALLGVEGQLPKIAVLASPQDLAGLKEDAPVRFLGFTHEGKKTPADQKFEPKMAQGTVFMATVAKNLPGQPRLLHVHAKTPPNFYGSPLFDEQGSLLGVYGDQDPKTLVEPGAPPDPGRMTDVHFVAAASAALVHDWTENRDERLWVVPTLPAPPEPSPNGGQ